MHNTNDQSSYWDTVAWEKIFSLPLDIKMFSSLVRTNERILDYGCGYGRITGQLWNEGYRNIVGVDTSLKMIERARQEYPEVHFEVLKGSKIPYDDASFDAFVMISVLTCIPSDDDQLSLMKEISRILRPNGILCLGDYFLQEDERNLQRYKEFEGVYGKYGVFELPEGAVLRHHDRKWIATLTAGFTTIDMSEVDITTMNGNPARAFLYFGRKISANK